MKGKNTIKLNQGAMLEAVQMWVDSAINAKPRVTAVRQIHATEYGDNASIGHYEIDVDTELASESPAQFVRAVDEKAA